MASISEQTVIPSPLEEVWPLLSDPGLVAACIPGAELAAEQTDGLWRGSIRIKFGPTVATFRGEVTLSYDHAARRCTIEGRGIDQRGASRALASGSVTASGAETTTLAVDGTYSVTGPLEMFANTGGVHVARALLGEFSANMARMVEERRAAEGSGAASLSGAADPAAPRRAAEAPTDLATESPPSAAAPAPTPSPARATELSAFKLLWQAFLSWLRHHIHKQGTQR
ncbi:MAG: hypothetical protein EXQ87_01900 [Alphaproteobacteria bacterium]|nr:hypothetical protein [Alphaproteobacteria bacterium]